jgi:signal transduction histidine kinase
MNSPDLEIVVQKLGWVVFKRLTAEGSFRPLNEIPAWLKAAPENDAISLRECSFFLDSFLDEAESFWAGRTDGVLKSVSWREEGVGDGQIVVQAQAIKAGMDAFLVLVPQDPKGDEMQHLLQIARSNQLTHELLAREIETKEVLAHCIVHDLANPLTAAYFAVEILGNSLATEAEQKIQKMALDALKNQRALIQDILDVFSIDTTGNAAGVIDQKALPDAFEVANKVVKFQLLSSMNGDVNIRVAASPRGSGWAISAEASRLERIFGNLIDNAVRHSPRKSEVVVEILDVGKFAEVRIIDQGHGAPAEAIPHLFKKLAPARSGKRGKAGLGLYFCRITVEKWGGEIGYKNEGAERYFWFRIPFAG